MGAVVCNFEVLQFLHSLAAYNWDYGYNYGECGFLLHDEIRINERYVSGYFGSVQSFLQAHHVHDIVVTFTSDIMGYFTEL